jgi:hypothetical protein
LTAELEFVCVPWDSRWECSSWFVVQMEASDVPFIVDQHCGFLFLRSPVECARSCKWNELGHLIFIGLEL